MEIIYTHIEGYDRPAPCGEEHCSYQTRYEKNIFFFEKKCRDYKIIDDIIICRYKKKIAEFNSHGFGNTHRV